MRTSLHLHLAGALLLILASPAVGTDPDTLQGCGYHPLPLVMEQRPANSPMYFINFDIMATVNDHMDIFRYNDHESGWGINDSNECGAYVTDSEMYDAWTLHWGNSVAREIFTAWCGYGCCEKIESDTAYNPAYSWVYHPSEPVDGPGEYSYNRIAMHEMCHVWGMPPETTYYAVPTIMLPEAGDALPDDNLMHAPDAYLLRRQYDPQTSRPTLRNLVVVSKFVHQTDLRWRKSELLPIWDTYSPGMTLDVWNLTIENTGTEDLDDVHVRFYIRPWDGVTMGQLIGDFTWGTIPAETWGMYTFWDLEIPYGLETGTYAIYVKVTMNGYEDDDRPEDSWTRLVDPVEIVGRSIEVTSPAAGESYFVADVMDIAWDSDNIGGFDVKIEVSKDGGASWANIATAPDTGSYAWTVTGPPGPTCQVRVSSLLLYPHVMDASENFMINGNYVRVEQPNGGEVFTPGSTAEIRWLAVDAGDLVDLDINCLGGWQPASPSPVAADAGVYAWHVPDTTSNSCTVRVRGIDNPGIEDVSDAPFTITNADVDVQTPAANETVYIGDVVPVEFDYQGTCGYLTVKLSRNPNGPFETAGQVSATADFWPWLVTDPHTTWARIMLQDGCDPTTFGVSGVFDIANRKIHLDSPNGGESWTAGHSETITWSSEGAGGTVDLYLERYGPDPAQFSIASNTPNDGTYSFNPPPDLVGNAYWVKVNSRDYPDLEDWSDEPFAIEPRLQIISPNGGEHLISGEVRTLKWTHSAAFSLTSLDYRVSGGPWITIVSALANNSGEYNWQVPLLPDGTLIRWRVSRTNSPEIHDISDGPMTIVSRNISVYAPDGGEEFTPGQTVSIRWTSTQAGHEVTVSESCDRGMTWTQIGGPVTNNGSAEIAVAPPHRDGCKVRVASTSFPTLFDLSEGLYSVANSPPVANDNIVSAFEDQRAGVDVLANDSDADGDELEIVNFSQPDHGSVTTGGRPGNLFYDPDPDFHGDDAFIYRVGDQHGGAVTGTVHITVAPVNDAPVAHDDTVEVPEGVVSRIEVLDNDTDVDGDPLTIMAMTSAMHGSASYSGAVVTYTPEPGYEGPDSFSYTVMDPSFANSTAIVFLTVSGD